MICTFCCSSSARPDLSVTRYVRMVCAGVYVCISVVRVTFRSFEQQLRTLRGVQLYAYVRTTTTADIIHTAAAAAVF